MTQHQLLRALTDLSEPDYTLIMVNSAIQRGEAGPMKAIKQLADLISSLGVALSAHERISTAECFRDVADKRARPLLKTT
jgi:hypothetical protein